MKYLHLFKPVLLSAFVFCLSSCDPETKEVVGDNQHRTDSILNVIKSPELKAINEKILNDPNNAGLYNERARIYLKLQLLEDAIYDSKRSIRIDSTKAEFYITEADIFFAANETRNAKEVLEKVVKKFPNNTEGLLKLGELFFIVKQYENAFTKINDALKLDQNIPKAYYLKGDIYKEIGDTAKAISSYETAIEQDNKNFNAFLNLGLIYSSRKSPLALEYFNNALMVQPGNMDALYAKAKLLQDIGKTEEAVIAYQTIIKLEPTHAFSLYNLGAIELELNKNLKGALDYFSKSINANPKYAEAYFARGVCYEELNDKDNAKADYQMCLQLKPNFEPAISALNDIGKKK